MLSFIDRSEVFERDLALERVHLPVDVTCKSELPVGEKFVTKLPGDEKFVTKRLLLSSAHPRLSTLEKINSHK
jgi:hypothetical protein